VNPISNWYIDRAPLLRKLLESGDKEIFIERTKDPIDTSGFGYRKIIRWYSTQKEANENFADRLMIERMKISAALHEMESWVENNQ
jgi:hypothetical protein